MASTPLIVRPSAKINFSLRVGPRGADGYHDLRTLLQTIAIGDRLTVTARRGPFALHVRGQGVPADRTNLVWRAAEALWRALGRPGDPRDVHVRLDKEIPSQAGLGGGSADAAAALVALNRSWSGRLGRAALIDVAATLGSDVPFFLIGGTAVGAGRGVELYPIEDIGVLSLIVLKPSVAVPTSDAYAWLDQDRETGVVDEPAVSRLPVRWPTGPIALVNDLQGPVVRRHPVVGEAIRALVGEGAQAAAMTGSGSAVFGVFSAAHVRRAARRLARPDWLVIVTRTLSRREAERHVGL